jgi:hypothetical protein
MFTRRASFPLVIIHIFQGNEFNFTAREYAGGPRR